jgi:hypothetical protein
VYDVSEEHVASIFRLEEQDKVEIRVKQVASDFNPEDRGGMFLQHVGSLSTDYTALYPRRGRRFAMVSVRLSARLQARGAVLLVPGTEHLDATHLQNGRSETG